MLKGISYLHRFLTTETTEYSSSRVRFWFSLSLVFAIIYSCLGLRKVFSSEYIIHDDVRSHVFWMRRFLDPDLFPKDLISDYFQSVAPAGYSNLYHLVAALGIDPLSFNKILPLFLALISTAYCFGVCLALFPLPSAGFVATLFLNQTFWMMSEIPSGTPRAFFYPLFLAFIYYLLRRSLIPCLVAIALQGLFYPQCIFISAGVLFLRLFRFANWRLHLSTEQSDYLFCGAGLGVSVLMLLPYALTTSEYEPVATVAEARNLPIFQSTGRKAYFLDDPKEFWLCAQRSGILPRCMFPPPQVWAAVLLPLLLRLPSRFPLAKKVSSQVFLLTQIFLVSVGLYFLAHAVLFKLHLPSRYTKHSIPIIIAIAGGIATILFLDAIFRVCQQARSYSRVKQFLTIGVFALITSLVFLYPNSLKKFPNVSYKTANAPTLYQFFAEQPKDSLVASLSQEANNIPTFSQRSVLVSPETAAPYHLGYYRRIKQRLFDLMEAQYTQDSKKLTDLINKYEIDFLLIDKGAFTPEYITEERWLRGVEPIAQEITTNLKEGVEPAILEFIESCSVFETEERVVLEAECLLQEGK